ncbi:hypothetical protein GGU11DRAFT_745813 [Lentinula aff. detonsa]|uniref:Transcription activator of gluconeogenesis ERT1 n=1 Tax=Lentinula aff. detonsa TaxID=2804958 RepID=A0AA38L715_9AGAR|nr:hypothetical protein GGU10DRAFT_432169 [Lentinula aff. detonsa]KAJ3796767.1 hypothetical protein GGU11DRAFT_745813 [Lentinula aff. detonsa]
MASVASNNTDFDISMDPSVHYPLLTTHPLTYSTMPMHMYPLTPSSQRTFHTKRRQVKNACTNCQKACKKCDDARPCLRCIKYGIPTECVDSQRKERKKGIKRGPYNKKRDCKGTGSVGSSDVPPLQQEAMPITNGEGPDNPSPSYPLALSLHYVGPSVAYAGTAYANQYSLLPPPLPPPPFMEHRTESMPSMHPTSRHVHSHTYPAYPPQTPQSSLPRVGSNQEYPSPPASYYQMAPPRPVYHHPGPQYAPTYAVPIRADLQQQQLMMQASYPYIAVPYGKPEDGTYLGDQGSGK